MQLPDQPAHPPGKILDHDAGLGQAGQKEVEARARELAMIDGLAPDEVTDAHRQQAVRELSGDADSSTPNDADTPAAQLTAFDDVIGQSGGATAPATNAAQHGDEESIGEALYTEGVNEATHDRMTASRLEEQQDEI